MSKVTLFVLALLVLTIIKCGNQDNSSNELSETVPAPKIDLHTAVFSRDFEAIRRHVKAGSDLNISEPRRNSSPLITAAAFGELEASKILIDAGANLNYKNDDGSTALHTAAFFGHLKIVEELLKKGTDKNLKNNDGKTALEIVKPPFKEVKSIYDAIKFDMKRIGIEMNYDRIKSNRPKIAALLEL